MRKLQIGILLGGILLAPFQAALAQEVAYATESSPGVSSPGYVIFFSNGPAHLSSVAGETIRMAAADADRSTGLVRVVGPIEYAVVVKDELVRDGVPAPSILVVLRTENALLAVGDGINEPASVEIHY